MRSVSNALTLIEELARQQPVGVSPLARSLDLPKSSVLRTLRTLEASGWAAVIANGPQWILTEKVLRVGLTASPGLPGLRELVLEEMTRLRDKYGETVHLGVHDSGMLVIVNRLDGTRSIRTFMELGSRAPLPETAGGIAILAAMPDDDIEAQIAELEQAGNSQVGRTQLMKAVTEARAKGYAVNRGFWRADIGALAAAVIAPQGRVVGALSIVFPLNRLEQVAEQGAGDELVRGCQLLRNAAADDL